MYVDFKSQQNLKEKMYNEKLREFIELPDCKILFPDRSKFFINNTVTLIGSIRKVERARTLIRVSINKQY